MFRKSIPEIKLFRTFNFTEDNRIKKKDTSKVKQW